MDSYRSEGRQERNKREEKKKGTKRTRKTRDKKITKSRLIEENTNMDPSKEVFCNSAKSITELTDSFAFAVRFVGGRRIMNHFPD